MEIIAIFSNLFFLILGFLVLSVRRIWSGESAKGYIAIAKAFVIADLLFTMFSYTQDIRPSFFAADTFSFVVYIITALLAYIWLSLSLKWFTSSGLPSCLFCILSILLLLCLKVLVQSFNLAVISVILVSILFLQYMLLRFSQENEEFHNISGKYLLNTLPLIFLLGVSLYILSPQNWEMSKAAIFMQSGLMPYTFVITAGFMLILLFMMGIAPLHFGITDIIGPAVLPVAAYFTFIPIMSLWTIFIKLNTVFFVSLASDLEHFYIFLGLISVIIGAIGANSSRNVYRIFAFMALLNLGIILMVISPFDYQSVVYGVCGILFYILTCLGVYTVFYGFKSQGEYLSALNSLYGFFKVRPFIALSFVFFLLSFSGLAPLWGFVNLWNLIYHLIQQQGYLLIIIIFVSLVLLLSALSQVVRTIFFASKGMNFDRTEFVVYMLLILNILLQIWLILNAGLLSETVNNLLSEVVS